jgi:hypothetical protein
VRNSSDLHEQSLQQQQADSSGQVNHSHRYHSQNCLQTLFFLSSFDETTTELHLHAEKLTETVLHLNLGQFMGVFFGFVLCCFVWFFSPLMRQ